MAILEACAHLAPLGSILWFRVPRLLHSFHKQLEFLPLSSVGSFSKSSTCSFWFSVFAWSWLETSDASCHRKWLTVQHPELWPSISSCCFHPTFSALFQFAQLLTFLAIEKTQYAHWLLHQSPCLNLIRTRWVFAVSRAAAFWWTGE